MPHDFEKQIGSAVQDLAAQLSSHAAEAEKRTRAAERKLQSTRNRLEREVQSRKERLAAVRQRERDLNGECRKLSRQLEKLNEQLGELSEQKTDLENRSEALGEHVRRLTDDHHAATDLFEHAHREISRKRQEVKNVKADADAKIEAEKEARRELETKLEAAQRSIEEADQKRADAIKKARRLSRQLAKAKELETGLAAATEVTESLRKELSETRKCLANEEQRVEELREELAAAKKSQRRQPLIPFRRRPDRLTPKTSSGTASPPTQPNDTPPAQNWFTRSADGTVYGPAGVDTLREWAADCRIGPGHEVSDDGEKWKPAAEWPELEMDRVVTLVDGRQYGPVHKDAAQYIVATGFAAAEEAPATAG